MLRANELSSMRATMAVSFADSCDILSNQGATGALGQAEDWQAVGLPVGCRVIPATGKDEQVVADKTTSRSDSVIILPYGTAVDASNRLHIHSSGVTYEVDWRHPAESEDISVMVLASLVE